MMMTQLHTVNPPQEVVDEKSFKKRKAHSDLREMKKVHSLDSEEPYDNLGDVIIPSTDKEGWCRNKKYIEKTDGGFMCMVCKKVYGRYNSVSYHVTIYHRNPPINQEFGQLSDQGSRRCPHCRHVSKSPAMLEKHIRRHQIVEPRDESAEIDSTSMEVVVVDDEITEVG
ncbi:zinc finger, C2H2 type [Cooperia oncophora]